MCVLLLLLLLLLILFLPSHLSPRDLHGDGITGIPHNSKYFYWDGS